MEKPASSANPAGGSFPKRILIVEDDDSVARLYDKVLKSPKYDLYRASNGEEALSLCALAPFDAIVSDLVMPGMSGRPAQSISVVARPSDPVEMAATRSPDTATLARNSVCAVTTWASRRMRS